MELSLQILPPSIPDLISARRKRQENSPPGFLLKVSRLLWPRYRRAVLANQLLPTNALPGVQHRQPTRHSPLHEVLPGKAGQLGGKDVAVGVGVLLGAARGEQGLVLRREQQQLLSLEVEAGGADEGPAEAQGPRAGGDGAGDGRRRGRDAGGDSAAGQQGEGLCTETPPGYHPCTTGTALLNSSTSKRSGSCKCPPIHLVLKIPSFFESPHCKTRRNSTCTLHWDAGGLHRPRL